MEEVILVDENDRETGTCEKLKAHQEGLLHRAFSIFVFNSQGELLVQRRAWTKYHSGGLWSNTCCSHSRPGEITEYAAHRRLKEEMGFDCELKEIFSFTYQVELESSLFEHEYDHVFLGRYDNEPKCDPKEVCDWKCISIDELRKAMQKSPDEYTYWFRFCFAEFLDYLDDNQEFFKNLDV